MKFVFFGSFHVSRDILEGLINGGYIPVAVVCSPDRPAGRKKIMTAPAVKTFIAEKQLPIQIFQPEQPNDIIPELTKLGADFFIVMGYPHIIAKTILTIPPLGTVGVHPSLLPAYRGASPMQSALLAGEAQTGVTLYGIDEKMDHGPILAQQTATINPDETNASLEKKLAHVAADLLIKTLPDFAGGKIKPKEQDHTKATFTKKFTTADAEVDMQKDKPLDIYRKIQAFTPEPGVWTMNFPGHESKRIKLLAARMDGTKIVIQSIQVEGKKPVTLTK